MLLDSTVMLPGYYFLDDIKHTVICKITEMQRHTQSNIRSRCWIYILSCLESSAVTIGSLSKSLRLALLWLPEVIFLQNVTLHMYVGYIQP